MTSRPSTPKDTGKHPDEHLGKQPEVSHPGMMGDGTEEQNLEERGNPAARIKQDEFDAAFGK